MPTAQLRTSAQWGAWSLRAHTCGQARQARREGAGRSAQRGEARTRSEELRERVAARAAGPGAV